MEYNFVCCFESNDGYCNGDCFQCSYVGDCYYCEVTQCPEFRSDVGRCLNCVFHDKAKQEDY